MGGGGRMMNNLTVIYGELFQYLGRGSHWSQTQLFINVKTARDLSKQDGCRRDTFLCSLPYSLPHSLPLIKTPRHPHSHHYEVVDRHQIHSPKWCVPIIWWLIWNWFQPRVEWTYSFVLVKCQIFNILAGSNLTNNHGRMSVIIF